MRIILQMSKGQLHMFSSSFTGTKMIVNLSCQKSDLIQWTLWTIYKYKTHFCCCGILKMNWHLNLWHLISGTMCKNITSDSIDSLSKIIVSVHYNYRVVYCCNSCKNKINVTNKNWFHYISWCKCHSRYDYQEEL